MAERMGAVGELASFLARMEGAAEVSDAHVATATTISTGTTLEDEPGELAIVEPAITHAAFKAGRRRPLPRRSGVAAGLLLAVVYCGVPRGTDDVQVIPEIPREAPPPVAAVSAPVAAAPAPVIIETPSPPPPPVSPNAALFARRADKMLELGDISGARLLYERAAMLGSGAATLSMARTFDPDFLSALHASIPADPAKSAEWYRRALAFGGNEAAAALRRLENQSPR